MRHQLCPGAAGEAATAAASSPGRHLGAERMSASKGAAAAARRPAQNNSKKKQQPEGFAKFTGSQGWRLLAPLAVLLVSACCLVSTTSIGRPVSASPSSSSSGSSSRAQGVAGPHQREAAAAVLQQAWLVSVSGPLAFWRHSMGAGEAVTCGSPGNLQQVQHELVAVEGATLRLNLALAVIQDNGTALSHLQQQQQVASRLRLEWRRVAPATKQPQPLDERRISHMVIDEALEKQQQQQPEESQAPLEEQVAPQRAPFVLAPYADSRHSERLAHIQALQEVARGRKWEPSLDSLVGESRSVDWRRLEAYLRAQEDSCFAADATLAAGPQLRLLVVQVELRRLEKADRGLHQLHLCLSASNCALLALQLQVLDDVPQLVGPWPQAQLLDEGERLTLRCQATGFTLPQITWYLDGQQLSEAGASLQANSQQQVSASAESSGGAGGERLRIGDYVSQDGVVHSFVNASRAQVSDGGSYKCVASNGLHQAERVARLDVRGPPQVSRAPQNATGLAGLAQLSLHCPYSGWPVAAIEWLHLAESQAESSSPARASAKRKRSWLEEEEEDWLAQASAITPGSLDDYPEPVPDDYPASADYADLEMDLQQQQQQQVVPTSSSRSKREATWIKLPQSRRHQLHPNGSLTIHELAQTDAGLYRCRVLGPSSSPDQDPNQEPPAEASSQPLYLSVLVAPVISPFASSESLREGMRNFLTCSVIEGDPPLQLRWFKDGQPLFQEPPEVVVGGGGGEEESWPQLALAGPPARARIRAQASNQYTSTLYFSQVEFADNGNYTCMASNKAASVNYTTRMLVNVAPKWSRAPKDVEAVAGQSVLIDCQAEAFPAARVWWELGVQVGAEQAPAAPHRQPVASSQAAAAAGQLIGIQALRQAPAHYRTIISNSHIHILENASLVIRDLGRHDQAFYLCQAANPFGSLSALIRLTVNVGASFASKYLLRYARLNERLELDCDPAGQGPLEAHWLLRPNQQLAASNLSHAGSAPNLHTNHNELVGVRLFNVTLKTGNARPRLEHSLQVAGMSLEVLHSATAASNNNNNNNNNQTAGPQPEVARLVIGQVSRQHSGDYVCRAANRFGADEKLFRVLVQEAPDPVEELVATQVGARQVSLAWRTPFAGNLPLLGYSLEWALAGAAGEPSWSQARHHLAHPTSFTLASLQPHSSYLIRVRAHNQLGQSNAPRLPLLVVTADEAPSAPPADLRARPLSSSSILLTWEPDQQQQASTSGGGEPTTPWHQIKGFYIGYRLANSSDPYVFKAVSLADAQQLASKQSAALNESSGAGSRRLAVQIDELRRNSRYSAIVQAFNSAGPGPQSDPVEARTLLHDPPGPAQVRASAAGHTSLQLQWWFPADANSQVEAYHLYYREQQTDSSSPLLDNGWQERILQPQQVLPLTSTTTTNRTATGSSYTLEGLECGHSYQVYLVGHNSMGAGRPSQVVRARTRGSAPLAPRAADYLVANTSSARLHLEAWEEAGCGPLSFSVRFRRLDRTMGRGATGSASGGGGAELWHQVPVKQQQQQPGPLLLQNLEPETWYLVETVAESAAGKTLASHSFMTLNRLGQVPSEALLESAVGVVNGLPSLFQAGARSILHTPLLISGSLLGLLIFATCSLLLARKYSRQQQQQQPPAGRPRRRHSESPDECAHDGAGGGGYSPNLSEATFRQPPGAAPGYHQQVDSSRYQADQQHHYSLAAKPPSSPTKTATTMLTGGSSENSSGLMLSGSSLCNDASYMSPLVAPDSLDLSHFISHHHQQQQQQQVGACNNHATEYFANEPPPASYLADKQFGTLLRPPASQDCQYLLATGDRFKTLPHKQRLCQPPATCDKSNKLICMNQQPTSNQCQQRHLLSEEQQIYSKLRLASAACSSSHSSYNLCQLQQQHQEQCNVPNPFPAAELAAAKAARQQIYNEDNELALLAKRVLCNGEPVVVCAGQQQDQQADNKLSSMLLDCHQQLIAGDPNHHLAAFYSSHPAVQPTGGLEFGVESESGCDMSLGCASNSNPTSSLAGISSSAGASSHQEPFLNLSACGTSRPKPKAADQQQQSNTGNQPTNGCNGDQNNSGGGGGGSGEYALPFLPKWV